jgi:hypothetical protein
MPLPTNCSFLLLSEIRWRWEPATRDIGVNTTSGVWKTKWKTKPGPLTGNLNQTFGVLNRKGFFG